MDFLELKVQSPPELVEPLVQLFQTYGKQRVAVEEAGGYNPDEGEVPESDTSLLTPCSPWKFEKQQRENYNDS